MTRRTKALPVVMLGVGLCVIWQLGGWCFAPSVNMTPRPLAPAAANMPSKSLLPKRRATKGQKLQARSGTARSAAEEELVTVWYKIGDDEAAKLAISKKSDIFDLKEAIKAANPDLSGVAARKVKISDADGKALSPDTEIAGLAGLGNSVSNAFYVDFPSGSAALAQAPQTRSLDEIRSMTTRPVDEKWIQAQPGFYGMVNEESYKTMLKEICESIRVALADPRTTARGDKLLLAAQNGMGTGKSHLVDSLLSLMDMLAGGVTLKVTYNYRQLLTNDVRDLRQRSHVNCLLTRIALAIKLERCDEVEDEISTKGCIREGISQLARFIDVECAGKPVLIAVDEIQMLTTKLTRTTCTEAQALEATREVLSVLRQLCEKVNDLREWDVNQVCLALVTSLPTLDITTVSEYEPVWLPPAPLDDDASRRLLRLLEGQAGYQLDDKQRLAVLALAGGHPRSLVVLAKQALAGQAFDVVLLRQGLKWPQKPPPTERRDLEAIIRATYLREADWQVVVEDTMSFRKSQLAMSREGTYMVPPILAMNPVGERDWLSLLYRTFSTDVTKDLEIVSILWDRARAELELPLLPSGFDGYFDPGSKQMLQPPRLRFLFDAKRDFVLESILSKQWEVLEQFGDLDPSAYYVPAATAHPGFEALFQVMDEDSGERFVCLHQEKVNSAIGQAVDKLNQASEALEKRWGGLRFIYVCIILDGTRNPTGPDELGKAAHPVIYVNRERLERYFTATFSAAAFYSWTRHKQQVSADISNRIAVADSRDEAAGT